MTATLARHDVRSSNIFDDLIRSLPQIIAADTVAGETDYLLTVVARDVAELQQVLASLALRGGPRLVTYLRLGEVKPPSRLPLGSPLAFHPAERQPQARQHDREHRQPGQPLGHPQPAGRGGQQARHPAGQQAQRN